MTRFEFTVSWTAGMSVCVCKYVNSVKRERAVSMLMTSISKAGANIIPVDLPAILRTSISELTFWLPWGPPWPSLLSSWRVPSSNHWVLVSAALEQLSVSWTFFLSLSTHVMNLVLAFEWFLPISIPNLPIIHRFHSLAVHDKIASVFLFSMIFLVIGVKCGFTLRG